ncbi:MAG TPA: hypothetical protein VHD31_00480 [Candidatus Paceibacterota bacterium]|nr:hypothetical protein [Candidatus Paceibacterota bacterium]
MNFDWKPIAAGVGVLVLLFGTAWFVFFRSDSTQTPSAGGPEFGVGDNRTVTVPLGSASSADTDNQIVSTTQQTQQKIFKITDSPVTSASFIQTFHPTTTIARFVLQENGHVFDLTLDNAGAVPRAVSNTTIPGSVQGVWTDGGAGVVLQYLDATVIKTVYLGLPAATTTSAASRPVRVQFLPDNVISVAASPDGKSIVYLLTTAVGSDGYISKPDGTNGKKLFSLPLSQIVLLWPAQNTILAQTKSAAGYPGMVFSISAATGAVSTLLSASGVTATADKSFSRVVYQTSSGVNGAASTYVHEVKTGKESGLSFDPIPEKCVWSSVSTSTMYCAAPLQYVPPGYLDLWHQGAATLPDALFSFNVSANKSDIIALPGGEDGGAASDITEIAVSPDEHYLLFIKKGDHSLWGVRLGSTQ